MKSRERFLAEIEFLSRARGEVVADGTCRLLVHVVRWLRQVGHGDVTLSAVQHRFSDKWRADSVFSAKEENPKEEDSLRK